MLHYRLIFLSGNPLQCQVSDWKVHKQLCGKKNITNVDSDLLLLITKKLVKTHADIVEQHTGNPLSYWQKNDAKVALVKQLKGMLTGDFQHFNSMNSMADR